MPEYLAPGVYYQRVDSSRRGIANLRTDIAGFVGIAIMGPLHTAVVVESFRQFESHFGGFTGNAYLAYAIRGFFENGGARCYVVRVADHSSRSAQLLVNDSDGQPAWRIRASSSGIWGNRLAVTLHSQREAKTRSSVGDFDLRSARVESLSAFVRGGLVKISQADKRHWRILSTIDGSANRIYWSHPESGKRLDSDQVIVDLDQNKPISITALSNSITVRQNARVLAHYAGLGLVAEHPRAATRLLAEPDYRIDRSEALVLPSPAEPIIVEEMRQVVRAPLAAPAQQTLLEGGHNGLASLTPTDFTGEIWDSSDSDQIRVGKTRGLQTLAAIDEVAILAVPDIHIHPDPDPLYQPLEYPEPNPCLSCPKQPESQTKFSIPDGLSDMPPVFDEHAIYRVQSAMIEQCERRNDRIALIDPPLTVVDGDARGIALVRDWRSRFDSRYAALYFPWLDVPDSRSRQTLVRRIPACGHVAGQYAGRDLSTGVHHAPANQRLQWVRNVSIDIDVASHGVLNPEGVNVIRTGPGRGIRLMGARTLSSDPDWRYVNVQRLFMMVMEAIDVALQWIVFEGNDHYTRSKVYMALSGFLTALWQQGALVGDEASQAFFVRCDEENNPSEVRDNGKLIADVGIAPSVPFEYIVMRVGRQGNTLEIENIGLGRAA